MMVALLTGFPNSRIDDRLLYEFSATCSNFFRKIRVFLVSLQLLFRTWESTEDISIPLEIAPFLE